MGAHAKVVWRDFGLTKITSNVIRAGFDKISVGVLGHKAHEPSMDGRLTNGDVAAINFYGSDDGVVPPRDFLVKPLEAKRKKVVEIFKGLGIRLINGDDAAGMLEDTGRKLAMVVRDNILRKGNIQPPNAPSTIAKKGFNHPLVWSYALAEAISYRLMSHAGRIVEAGAATFGYESFEIGGGE